MHWKDIIIHKISLAKRYKKVDENGKFVSYLHDRIKDISFQSNPDSLDKFREDDMYKPDYENSSKDDQESIKNTFEAWPFIQNYEELMSIRFKQEKEKGLLLIENVLELYNNQDFPPDCDIIIDF